MLIFRTLGRTEQNYNLEVVMHLAVFTLSLNVTHKCVGKGFVGIGCVFCSAVQELNSVTSLFQNGKGHRIILQAFGYSCVGHGFDFVVVI